MSPGSLDRPPQSSGLSETAGKRAESERGPLTRRRANKSPGSQATVGLQAARSAEPVRIVNPSVRPGTPLSTPRTSCVVTSVCFITFGFLIYGTCAAIAANEETRTFRQQREGKGLAAAQLGPDLQPRGGDTELLHL